MSTTTQYLSLTKWDANDKFDYTQLAANWDSIDSHDHSSGHGKKITSAGIAQNTIIGGTSGNIAAQTITENELSFTAIPKYRAGYNLPKTQSSTAGTIALASSGAVTGTSTAFDSSMVGATLTVNNLTFVITDYTSSTSITVSNPNATVYPSGTSYSINYTLADSTQVSQDSSTTSLIPISLSAATPSTPSSGNVQYTSSSAHNLRVGQLVTITGFSPSGYNVTAAPVVAIQDSTHFSIANSTTGAATPTSAQVTTTVSKGTISLRYQYTSDEWDFTGGSKVSTTRSDAVATTLSSGGGFTADTYGAITGATITLPYKGTYLLEISADVYFGASLTATPSALTASSPSAGIARLTLPAGNVANATVGTALTLSGVTTTTGYNGTWTINNIDAVNNYVYLTCPVTGTAVVTGATATWSPSNSVYLYADTTTPSGSLWTRTSTPGGPGSAYRSLHQTRLITTTSTNTTYQLYTKATIIAQSPTVSNWSISATPVSLTTN